MDYRQFLNVLYKAKPKKSWINIWQGQIKRSKFFDDVNAAADFIEKLKDKKIDLYVNCGIVRDNLGPRRRGSKEDIIALPGYYMDIDFKSPSKPNCPPDVNAAISLVKNNGFDPTIIVHTGNGIHVWWVFKEPWVFADSAEANEAEMFNRRVSETILAKAAKQKWILDSVFDRTRLLRIPDTFNCKNPLNTIQTKVIEFKEIFHEDPRWIDEFVIAQDQIRISANVSEIEKKKIASNLILDPMAEPPPEKFDWLSEADEKFKHSWTGTRKDMKKGSSPSEHAMSLASIAAQANWEDQEIANLIIAFYRRHGDIKKAMRPDFIGSTLARARVTYNEKIIEEYLEKVAPAQGSPYEKDVDPEGKKAKAFVNATLGINIMKIIQYRSEKKSKFRVCLDIYQDGIMYNTAGEFMDQKIFSQKVYEKCLLTIPTLKKPVWERVLKDMARFIIVEVEDESTVQLRMKNWIEFYLQEKDQITLTESARDNEPFVHEGFWHIYPKVFHNWAYQNKSFLESFDDIKTDLTIIGGKKMRFNPQHPDIPNKRKKCEPFRIPHAIAKPSPQPQLIVDNTEKQKPTDSKGRQNAVQMPVDIDLQKSDGHDLQLPDKAATSDRE